MNDLPTTNQQLRFLGRLAGAAVQSAPTATASNSTGLELGLSPELSDKTLIYLLVIRLLIYPQGYPVADLPTRGYPAGWFTGRKGF